MSKLFYVGGGKGGVGKSIATFGLYDYLKNIGKSVVLVDTDTSNPDVFKSHENVAVFIDLDTSSGWIDLINLCDKNRDKDIIINSAARSNKGVNAYGKTLTGMLKDLDHELVVMWVLNRTRETMEALFEFKETIDVGKINVIRNLYFGEANKFTIYNESNFKVENEKKGGLTLDLPDVADRISDRLINERLSVESAFKTVSIGERAEIQRWRNEIGKNFGVLYE